MNCFLGIWGNDLICHRKLVVSGQWAVVSGQCAVVSGQWAVASH